MHKHITFQDILNTLRDKYGEGFYRFKIRDNRLVGANIYEDDRADPMDDEHSSIKIEKKILRDRIFFDKREMKPVFGHNPVEVLK